ncbi:Predicted arabinose efflux permease, MFS family [Micromonospora echinaurantiaca]|uniref:Predicted arabinose efflux permease, MFS family n=1 Tax=Micromonospora echinaurantiaca TaxID=47857 RepID=A0A1C5IG94_9ACTN|nr:MFS transporter [Micromonospora echinaurantiaca]SCG57195.1 Predicted arabinose efflux permease, MFS family [Micromonospora echinaurantiaca]
MVSVTPGAPKEVDGDRSQAPAWSNPHFRRLWRGSAASTLGAEMAELALPLFALVTLSASAAQAGILRVVQFLPFLLATLPAGLLVDRFRRGRLRLMIIADLGRVFLVALVPVAAWTGVASMPGLYVVVFAVALLTVLFQVADFAVLPAILAEEQLVDANGKLSAAQSAAEIGGRGLGGLLVQALSAPVALLLNAFGYLMSAVSLSRIRLTEPDRLPVVRGSAWRDAVNGIGVTIRHRYVRPLLGEAATFNLFNEAFILGLLLYAVRDAHLNPLAIGAVFTAGGLGSFAGAWFGARFTARFGYGRVLLVTLVLGNGAPLGVLFANRAGAGLLPLLCAVFVVMGVGIGMANVHAVSLRQAAIPEDRRGRVNAAYRLISWGAIPVGAALGGALATQAGPFAAMAVGAVGVSLATLWVALSGIPTLASIHDAARP